MFARILLLLAPIASLGCGINNNCGPFNPFGCAKDDGADGFGTTAVEQTTNAPTTSTSTSTSTTDASTVDPTLSSMPSTTEDNTSSTDVTTMVDPATGTSTTMDSTGTTEVTTGSSTTTTDGICGDGKIDDGEKCDDGNIENYDKCSNACTIVEHRKVFVSSMAWTQTLGGNLGGLDGADKKCDSAAKKANLNGTFIAWLSTDDMSNAAGRIGTDFEGVYELVNGSRVAVGWVGLTEKPLDNAINRDENGTETNNQVIWTNTKPNGASAGMGHCNNWMSNSLNVDYNAHVGNSSSTDSTWTQDGTPKPCGSDRRLYCFQVGP